MRDNIGKVLGLFTVIAFLVIILSKKSVILEKAFTQTGIGLLLPLGLIWFADELGGFTGYRVKGSTVNAASPAILVAFMGWLFLIGWPVAVYFIN